MRKRVGSRSRATLSRPDRRRGSSTRVAVCGLVASVLFVLVGMSAAAAPQAAGPGTPAVVRQVQVLELEQTGVPSPRGLAFAPASGAFYVLDAGPGPSPSETEIVTFKPFQLRPGPATAGSVHIASAVQDPINVAFDARRNRLLLLGHARELLEVRVGPGGDLDPSTLARRDAGRFGLRDPQGMMVDPASGTVFLLDATQPRILRVEPAPDGSFEQARVSEIDLRANGLVAPRGLAFDPSSGHLHVRSADRLYELTQAGEIIATRDLAGLELVAPQGMAFAPSGDLTDDPGQLSVYVADGGGGATQSSGQIVELSLTSLPEAAAADFTSSLVNTVNMAAWNPPSPDPSGIAYLAASNRLIMVDGEVEETVSGITHFRGANVWVFTPGGSVIRTANISRVAPTDVPMTNEPTGVAFNPGNGHYYISDDGQKEVFDLNPGGDGLVGTSDDSWTSFDTLAVGNADTEGVAYDPSNGHIFVADGVNAEVYEYTTAGALVNHFDVQRYGVADPETVEYKADSNTLLVLSNRQSGPIIVETSISGALLQTIDVSAAGARKPAGVTYAPASNGSGAKRFYFVDRGVDNNSDPRIIDGKMYEMTAPASGPPGNTPPTVSAGPDQTIALPGTATLNGTVTDDGLPNPPGAVTTTWTQVSGPGTVTFANASAVDTTATLPGAGPYVLRLTANDGAATASDDVTISAPTVPGPLYLSLRDAATVDTVSATNEDILFYDGTNLSLFFDGSDVGIGSLRIDAFARVDASTVLLSFDAAGSVPGIAGTVDDSDIVQFVGTLGPVTSGTFSLYLDGSDVGLTQNAHDVDAVEPLPDGRILVSTTGSAAVTGATTRDEDLLAFTHTSLGDNTSGTFALYFDGSDVGLGESGEDVDAAAVDASGKIYLSTPSAFAVPGVSGQDEDVFVFTPSSTGSNTAGSYSPGLYFDGSSFGLGANDVFAIDLP